MVFIAGVLHNDSLAMIKALFHCLADFDNGWTVFGDQIQTRHRQHFDSASLNHTHRDLLAFKFTAVGVGQFVTQFSQGREVRRLDN